LPGSNTTRAPLHRLLFGTVGADGAVPDSVALPADRDARSRLDELAATSGGLVAVETATVPRGEPLAEALAPTGDLAVRSFGRALDRVWRRTSYTGIIAGLHEAPGATTTLSEPEQPGILDEPVPVGGDVSAPGSTVDESTTPGAELDSPMAALPVGAAFGTLVHSVLERADFAAPGLAAELEAAAEEEGSGRFVGVEPRVLADAMVPALETPLGPLAGGVRLADLARTDRLDELEFELPLAGGDVPTGEGRVADIAALLRRHLGPDDPLAGYPDDLAVPAVAGRTLRGFLTGSIDAVLRVRADDAPPRYVVVDYKTNWLGAPARLTAWDYRPEVMAVAMRHAHYPLQALLYSVALHRYLRWRQPGYDPAVHLGGVLYLFLRGMCGPSTPVADGTPYGVFSWKPPAALVTDLSDLLHGGAS
jgi:exodeoxyribonuclease V beta subunit